MNLQTPIVLYPPPHRDPKNNLIKTVPLTLNKLNIIYINRPDEQRYSITIEHVPAQITLFYQNTYNENITPQQARQKLLEISNGDLQSFLQNKFPKTLEQEPHGPGTILSNMLSIIGIKSSPTCSCKRHALEMNSRGVDWCENNVETICEWLKAESVNRNIPYVDGIAKIIVVRAIKKAKKYREKNEQR